MKSGKGTNPFEEEVSQEPDESAGNNQDDGEDDVQVIQENQEEEAGDDLVVESTSTMSNETENATETATDNEADETSVTRDVSSISVEASSDSLDESVEIDPAKLADQYVPESYDLPHAWALGRDSVKDGRPKEKTFFLQESVLDLEDQVSDDVEEILGEEVSVTDLREAALIISYSNPELVAALVSEWGAEHA